MPDKRLMQGLHKAVFTNHGDPQTPKDQALSTKHLLERLMYDQDHAAEHREAIGEPGHEDAWNRRHAEGHEKDMAKTLGTLEKRGLIPGGSQKTTK